MVPCSFAGAKGKVAAPAALIFGWGAHCNAGSKRGGPAFSQRAPDCLTARVASQLQCMRTSHSIRSDQDTLLAQFDSHSPVTFLPVGRLAGRRGPWSNSPSPFLPRSIGSGLQTDWFLLYHGLTKGQELKAKVVCARERFS